jgi:SAM-dependent methyltransferase
MPSEPSTRPEAFDFSALRRLTGDCLRPGGLDLTRRVLGLAAFPPGSRILDLGCGAGASLGLLGDSGFSALGLDRSLPLLRQARARGPALRADMAALPLADACLDGLLCECALSLAPDKGAVLRECRRVLRRGGRLMLTDIVLRAGLAGERAAYAPCLQGAVSAGEVKSLLKRNGFRLRHAEDHSRALAELAARLVWEHGSPDALASRLSGGAHSPGLCRAGAYGYGVFVAETTESHHEIAQQFSL